MAESRPGGCEWLWRLSPCVPDALFASEHRRRNINSARDGAMRNNTRPRLTGTGAVCVSWRTYRRGTKAHTRCIRGPTSTPWSSRFFCALPAFSRDPPPRPFRVLAGGGTTVRAIPMPMVSAAWPDDLDAGVPRAQVATRTHLPLVRCNLRSRFTERLAANPWLKKSRQ